MGHQALSPCLVESFELGSAEACHAVLLVGTQPGLLGVTQYAPRQEIQDQADDDEDKGDGVQVLDGVAKEVNANDDAPEVARQQADIKEGGGAHAQDDGGQAVEDEQGQGVAHDVADGGAVPGGLVKGVAVKDGSRGAADEDADEAHKRKHLVDGPSGDVPLLEDVAQAVARGARQAKQVALELVGGRAVVGPRHGVGAQEHAHAAAGDEDAQDLKRAIAHFEQEERHDDDADNGPEVEEGGAQDVGVAIGQHGEVVALDVEEAENQVAPAVLVDDPNHFAPAVAVEHVGHVDQGEEHVVEKGLKGRNRSVVVC